MAKRELGIMETAQAFTNENCPFNAVVILRVNNGPSKESLRQALDILQRRHPLLGVHIRKKKKGYFFETAGTPEIPLNVINRKNNEHWQQVAEEELNRILDFLKGPLVNLTYLTGPSGEKESEILLTFHHAIVDAASGAHLVHEMLCLCGSSADTDLKNMALIPPAEFFFPATFKGIRRKWHNLSFIFRQVGDEFRFRLRSKGLRKPPLHNAGRCKILTMTLSREMTAALCKRARRKRVTLNSLFEAAISMAVHKHIYEGKAGPFRGFSMADLRPYLIPPLKEEYLGSYFAMLRFTVAIKENPQVWELARDINGTIYSALKRGDKFSSYLLGEQMMRAIFRFKAFRMAATAISYTGPVKLAKNYGQIEVGGIHAYVSNFALGPEYTAAVRMFAKQFYWDILYLDSDMGIKTAQVVADEIKNILESAVKEED
jgi:NRPS condensation-like uncharacterized protein